MAMGIVSRRSPHPAGRHARPAGFAVLAMAASAVALSPLHAADRAGATAAPSIVNTIGATAIAQYYDARGECRFGSPAGSRMPLTG